MPQADSPDQPQITSASPAQQRAALDLLSSRLPPLERQEQVDFLEQQIDAQSIAVDDLLVATRGDALVGAILGHAMPGRIAAVWPPQIVALEPHSTLRLLEETLEGRLRTAGVRLVQATIATDDAESQQQLVELGYDDVANLVYMAATLGGKQAEALDDELAFVPCPEEKWPELAQVMQATYEGTLDCPRLDGLRDPHDVLASYLATGEFDPQRWLLVRYHETPVGCVFLTDHPSFEQWEIVYMGLIPSARGQGWGAKLIQFALEATRRAGRRQMVLAVDRQNKPALRLYRAAGFQPWSSRRVFVRQIDGSS